MDAIDAHGAHADAGGGPPGAGVAQAALRLFVADDQPLVVDGIRSLCARAHPAIDIVGVAAAAPALIDAPGLDGCDVLLVDPRISGRDPRAMRGLPLLREIRRRHPRLPLVVLTQLENPALLRELLSSGIRTVISKQSPSAELLVAVRQAAAGGTYLCAGMRALAGSRVGPAGIGLSRREHEVIRLLAHGMTVTAISACLCRSVKTVSHHKVNAMRKLGIENQSQLYAYALEAGLDV